MCPARQDETKLISFRLILLLGPNVARRENATRRIHPQTVRWGVQVFIRVQDDGALVKSVSFDADRLLYFNIKFRCE